MARTSRAVLRATAALLALVLGYGAVTFMQVWWASTRDAAQPAQAIVVLGAAQYNGRPSPAYRARLDHAAALHQQGLAPIVVVTGGRRPGDTFTEARAGHNYLIREGLEHASLRMETTGRNSWESLAATARFLRGEQIHQVVLVSDGYHAYRIAAIAEEVGLDAHVSPTPAARVLGADRLRALAREAVAVCLGRVVGYRRLTNLERALSP